MTGSTVRNRGRLHIFLGAAPGVGKTYAMLREGHRLEANGVDVVIGLVETHGRADTAAQIGELEVIPRVETTYGGVRIDEMDVRAILARKPAVVLVDELAHTNRPGSARAKRWEDVELLLDAGIDIYATLNIQHIESLNDVVESITGIHVRETIPDKVIDQASEVQLVDLPVDSLLERMERGKIYPADQAHQALRGFFRTGNLTALRELALRRTAEGVDDRLETYMRENDIDEIWPASERVLAWLEPGPGAGAVLRKAWRLASGLRGELVAVIAATGAEHDRLKRLAEDLGCQVVDEDVTVGREGIVAAVQAENAHILVMGRTAESGWRQRFKRSLIDDLYNELENVDIYLVETEPAPSTAP